MKGFLRAEMLGDPRRMLLSLLSAIYHIQDPAKYLSEFILAQEVIGVGGAAVLLVAPGKGLVQQNASGSERFGQIGQQRPVQIIGHHDGAKLVLGKGPGIPGFQIEIVQGGAGHTAQILETAKVSVEKVRGQLAAQKQASVASAATGQVEHRTGADAAGVGLNPRVDAVSVWVG